jgi:predicted Zn-dependent protease
LADEACLNLHQMKLILTQMAAKQAPRILGESGKTISDGDRERVKEIVGDAITAMSDPQDA